MEKESVIRYLVSNPDLIQYIKKAVEWEESNPGDTLGWEALQAGIPPHIANKLVYDGIARISYKSRSSTCYKLMDLSAAKEAVAEIESAEKAASEEEKAEIPKDLFEPIVGHKDVKDLFWDALSSPKPIHVLLYGPPASAKSLFLYELDRLPNSYFALGGQTSQVGLAEEMFQRSPKYLIIDELDDMPKYEQSVLKSLMESGVITVRKHNIRMRQKFSTWVFGACNNPTRLSDAVLSRFIKVRFEPYTLDKFKEVVVSVLTKREGVDTDLANYIADRVGRYSRDPRDAVSLSRVARTKDKVDKYVELIFGTLGRGQRGRCP